jgi:hypothetical protein
MTACKEISQRTVRNVKKCMKRNRSRRSRVLPVPKDGRGARRPVDARGLARVALATLLRTFLAIRANKKSPLFLELLTGISIKLYRYSNYQFTEKYLGSGI